METISSSQLHISSMIRSPLRCPTQATHERKFHVDVEQRHISNSKNWKECDGRTTGIEPAHGGFTIHCLDPLGYIRPYPRVLVSVSIYDQILSEPSL
ncbi:hypothetical protein IEQ34_025320 [Dendrobium chrysotoxum]|uniref:Uncharacterized protein n=1 Tax=Dendrobium chrysotoxum TaxID=161865 RepID=A0AAV7FQA1_DENCH|nr:hypothetical protein IEQ34_025320 [Dendrobium chrysotoxum]